MEDTMKVRLKALLEKNIIEYGSGGDEEKAVAALQQQFAESDISNRAIAEEFLNGMFEAAVRQYSSESRNAIKARWVELLEGAKGPDDCHSLLKQACIEIVGEVPTVLEEPLP